VKDSAFSPFGKGGGKGFIRIFKGLRRLAHDEYKHVCKKEIAFIGNRGTMHRVGGEAFFPAHRRGKSLGRYKRSSIDFQNNKNGTQINADFQDSTKTKMFLPSICANLCIFKQKGFW